VLFVLYYKPAVKIFNGYLEVRALLPNRKYSALETPDLSTFAGRTSLKTFLRESLSLRSERILEAVDLGEITITPGTKDGEHIVTLTNKGNCIIMDHSQEYGKKIQWENGQRLIFTNDDNAARLEITYRTETD